MLPNRTVSLPVADRERISEERAREAEKWEKISLGNPHLAREQFDGDLDLMDEGQ